MRKYVCPRCGREIEAMENHEIGLCSQCVAELTSLQYKSSVSVEFCSRCGFCPMYGMKFEDLEEVVHQMVMDSFEGRNVEFDIEKRSENFFRVHGKVVDRIGEVETEKMFDFFVKFVPKVCDVCSRKAGGYYEAIIQIRSPSREKCLQAESLVKDMISSESDRMAFITKRVDVRGGIDIFIGSKKIAKKVCSHVVSEMGGSVKTSATLVGKKDGKDVYRVTYSLRLPLLAKGDVVEWKGRTYVVTNVGEKISLTPIEGGKVVVLPLDERLDVIGNIGDVVEVQVLSSDESAIEVMHPRTYETVWIRKNEDVRDRAIVLLTKKGLIHIPNKFV